MNTRGLKTWEGEAAAELTAGARRLRASVALPMRYRRLRIGLSACGSIAAVLLIALWVRSYWRWDSVSCNTIGAGSGQGIIVLAFDSRGREGWWWTSSYYENDIKESARPLSTRAFEWKAEPGAFAVFFAHWLLLVPLTLLTVAPWMSWRFSVRTLLALVTIAALLCVSRKSLIHETGCRSISNRMGGMLRRSGRDAWRYVGA